MFWIYIRKDESNHGLSYGLIVTSLWGIHRDTQHKNTAVNRTVAISIDSDCLIINS